MKLTKQLEKEILKVYDNYWRGYMNGDMKAFAAFLDDDVKVIGSTETEVFFTKKEALRFYKPTAKQIKGKAELRNRIIKAEPAGNLILITEQSDFYILIGSKWTFYAKGRLSTFFHNKNGSWKIIQQHGSMPDIRAMEGEQYALEKISKENLELRDAVKRRTIELENKNRELEIETALEKVRAIAMGMKNPADMLDVCKTISQQLQSLGVKEIRNVQTAIFYESRGTYMNYEYYAKHRKTIITETSYTNHKVHLAFAKKMLQGKGEIYITHIKGNKVKEWIAYQKTTNVFIDPFLQKAGSLNYYWHSLGPVALGISTYAPLSKDDLSLFKRFLNVFELAYTRYLDIEQALAQAREAQIEASLEKVRAQALGMRKPEDLPNVCETLFKELQTLGFGELRNAMINIHNDEKRSFVNYDYSDEIGKSITPLFYNENSVIKKQIKQIRSADDAFSETVFKGNDLKKWKEFRRARGEKEDKRIKNSTALYYYFYSIGTGSIGISTFDAISEEKQELLKRFRNVFAFAYRRYMDVAQAEAQAYEAKIEASLERVRAQAMSIRKSEELASVGEIIFTELKSLGFTDLRNTEIIINNRIKNSVTSYYYSDYGVTGTIDIDTTTHPTIKRWAEGLKKGSDSFIANHISEKEMNEWRKYRESLGYATDVKLNKVKTVEYYSYSIGLGALSVSSFKPVNDEQLITLKRFKNVFGLAYRRYADVAQAEAQAKESRIELGLERVRARAMAMQNSDELAELVSVLFKELTQLDFALTSCIIWISDTQTLTNTLWVTSSEMNKPAEPVRLKPFHHSFFHSIIHAWKEKDPKWIYTLAGKEKTSFEKAFFADEPNMPVALKKALSVPKKVVFSASFNNFGALEILGTEPLTDEKFEILHRFGKVFDSSYTRFNDLKKAEAQAREAQIETGLERVRSRSMAMHNTSELQEVIHTVHKELLNLNIAINGGSFIAINRDVDTVLHCWGSGGTANTSEEVRLPLYEKPFCTNLINRIKSAPGFFTEEYTQKEKKDFFTFLFKHEPWSKLDAKQKRGTLSSPAGYTRSCCVSQHTSIFIINHLGEKFSAADNDILQRFGKVFEQSYTRFLDLQKAEAQAREAQIEAALERVRSRTNAMHSSKNLHDVIKEVNDQLQQLGFHFDATDFLTDYSDKGYNIWIADFPTPIYVPAIDHRLFDLLKEVTKRGDNFFTFILTTKEKNRYFKNIFENTLAKNSPEELKQYVYNAKGMATSCVVLKNITLSVTNFASIPYTDTENEILKRFAYVFEQSYTRFLDLQKAEAQAREAKIEAALERTRTQSMIMQHSKELDDTLRVFHEQVLLLGIHSAFSFLWLPDEEKDQHIFWAAWGEDKNSSTVFKSKAINYPLDKNEPATAQCLIDWKSNEPVYSYHVPPAAVENYFAVWQELIDGVEHLKPEYFSDGLHYVEAFMKYGCFGVMCATDLTEDEKKILSRFAIEFERTYTRFLDLQKAEAQAREAQIETALERVRSRTMGMQKSEELREVIQVVYEQFVHLNIQVEHTGFVMDYKTRDDYYIWIADHHGAPSRVTIPYFDSLYYNRFNEAKEKGEDFFATNLSFEEKNKFYQKLFDYVPGLTEEAKKFYFSCPGLAASTVLLENVGLYIENFSGIPFTDEDNTTLMRFGKVFQQTYTRFLDLQKAEAQAREAKIETALEKVRSRTMAMQKSFELGDVATVLFKEMNQLVDNLWTCGFVLCEKNRAEDEWWLSTETGFIPGFYLPNTGDRVHENLYTGWKNREIYRAEQIEGAELDQHYEWLMNIPVAKKVFDDMATAGFQKPVWQKLHGAYFSKGYLVIITQVPCREQEVFKRFAQVFDLTYTRFLDLQKAEAQAREAQIEAALERVRSRTMAMQKSDELPEAANVLFKQVQSLGIPAWSCGYNILAEDKKSSTCIMSSEGEIQVPFVLPLTEHWSLLPWYEAIQNNLDFFVYGQGGEDLIEHYKYLATVPGLEEVFQQFDNAGISLPENQINHLVRFTNGFLLFITYESVPHAHDIFIRFGKVFEQTYTRFLDLQLKEEQALRLREEKIKLEQTLGELQTTQKQLIQTEKMASLGELTAGIAHEIQNPLNFVNNFSEVSNELIQEMVEEVEKGNYDLAKEIAEDVKQNLEKINNHGKRADAIVKGMLQHSRSSAGTKEPTDINALADEYLRLSYHGLRAKDKSFNAKFETGFDPSVGKINVMPQDIGRVILNLINNAFYAVDEKKKQNKNGYDPTIAITTKKRDDKIEITVKDNGNGIPQKVLDKIFQPFFTTKPTGQGTGLGLSLAYDIIKAHGGEINVGTKEGEGTEFIISLPVNQ